LKVQTATSVIFKIIVHLWSLPIDGGVLMVKSSNSYLWSSTKLIYIFDFGLSILVYQLVESLNSYLW